MIPGAVISRIKSSLGDLRFSKLLRAGFWLTFANVAGGLLGYIYQILMGRMLSPPEFALFSAIMSLIMFASSPLGAMYMVISRRVSALLAREQFNGLSSLYKSTHKRIALVAIAFLLLLIPFADILQYYLKSPNQGPIWVFGIFLVLGAFFLINSAYFQGMQRFGWLGGTIVSSMALKILLSVLFVTLGYGVSGALLGVVLATGGMWLLGLVINLRSFPARVYCENGPVERFPVKDVLPVLIANIAFATMTQLDMVLVNWYFTPEQAGLYAAASVFGKAVLYLPGGLVMALYPLVAENDAQGRGSSHIFLQAVSLTIGLCGLIALGYWLASGWLIALVFGPSYAGAGDLLRWYGLAILPMALVMVAEHFLIAKGRVLFAWLFLGTAPLQVLAIHLRHDQLLNVVAIMAIIGTFLFVLGYAMLWREYRGAPA